MNVQTLVVVIQVHLGPSRYHCLYTHTVHVTAVDQVIPRVHNCYQLLVDHICKQFIGNYCCVNVSVV